MRRRQEQQQQPCLAMSAAVWCLVTAAYLGYALADDANDVNDPHCYKADRKFCPNDGKLCRLNRVGQPTIQMYCCNLTNVEQIDKFLKENNEPKGLTGLHIRDSTFLSLNLKFFDRYTELTSLSITDSKIYFLGQGFEAPHPVLTCLDISDNLLPEFMNLNILTGLVGLKKLVIANNTNMTALPHLPHTRSFIELDVSNNNVLECKFLINITEYVFYKKMQINQLNKNTTSCAPPARYFGNKIEVKMNHIDQVAEIFRNCPSGEEENCSCIVASLEGLENDRFAYHALVNCSGRRLTSLPKILPPFTRILDVSNNSITSLEGISNGTYSSIKTLYADYNNITSLKPLEGTIFFENFQNLSLTNNQIDDIPRHILTNLFDRNPGSGRRVLLAKNTLTCKCETATVMKNWLQSVMENVPDYRELFTVCDGVPMRVLDMNPKDYCPSNHLQHYLKYVIFGEIALFVLLVAKVSYDYYIFKTAGYLPWPASKMPKLPCDWCFET